jgi:Ternary complex associated domain 9
LRPKPFFHGDAGVILFSLVPDETNICEPAPMLEQCLKALWDEEIFHTWNDQQRLLETSNLCPGLENITRSIAQLNKERPTNGEFPCLSNPSIKYIQKMEQRQITWKFCSQAIQARDLAEQQFEQLAESAVVHGDLHLGNILVRGERDMHLIDYAGSGPGHPAIDLVRLELALYLGWFMQTEGEDRYVQFQRRLSLDIADTAKLEHFFGDSYLPAVNKVCIGGCAAARDRVLETVKAHGGSQRDYLAAKYLVAWQSLLMQGRQTSLIRSIINALAPEIASW